jgi:hypothetical protein
MINAFLNILFPCRHRNLSRPVGSTTKRGEPPSQAYVVCLDCGKRFAYDFKDMKMGRVIESAPVPDRLNVPPGKRTPRPGK